MKALFVHQNAPGQYAHILRKLAADPGNQIVVLSQTADRHVPGTRTVVYPAPSPAAGAHPHLATTDAAVRTGEAAMRAALDLRKEGFRPDIMVGHNAWGETLFLKDVWPDVPLLSYFEFYYAGIGADVGFDKEFPHGFDDLPRARVMNAVNLMGLEAADWGQTPTVWQWSRFPERHRQRISVFHEGVDVQTIRPNPRIGLQLPDGSAVRAGDEIITFVSRVLEPYRGFHVFMRALPEILRRRPRARVLVVGGEGVGYGPRLAGGKSFREALLEQLGDAIDLSRVYFMGQTPRAQFTAILQASAVHVYLTYPFVLSWSMLEAMSAGCLVVGSATPPVQELIRDGENGLLVDFFDTAGLARRIDEALSHPERMAEIRRRARETIVERYDIAAVCVPQMEKVMAELIGGRTPTPGPQLRPNSPPAPAAPQGAFTISAALALAAQAQARGDDPGAEQIYRQLIDQRPQLDQALYALALLLHRNRRFTEAAEMAARAVRAAPETAHYHADLGVLYKAANRHHDRLDCYRRALALEPANYMTWMNIGSGLIDVGDDPGAEQACLRAVRLGPGHYGPLTNLANAQARLNKLDDAIDTYRQALRLRPDDADLNKNIGMCLMLRGDLAEGAERYEHRLRTEEVMPRDFPSPRWSGEPLRGRSVLLHAEQGLGDTLHFCRYAPLVQARGGRVILEAHKSLIPLLRSAPGIDQTATLGEPTPAHDLHCSLLSLMKVFETTLDNLPADIPYLRAEPARRDRWAGRLTRRPGALQVGLVWAGSPTHLNDRRRSLSLELLKPHIDAAPDVDFHSLQVGPARERIAAAGLAARLPDLGCDFADFTDTAAVIDQLDLVLSVDTSIVHLAGAMGRPVWTMVTHAPDWRWLLDRDDSPWYPSMRLFRQGADCRWEPVLEQAFTALKRMQAASSAA